MPLERAMELIDGRDAWTAFPAINVPRHPAEKHLKGLTIVLDPGHGGEDGGDNSTKPPGYKAGPTGAKEAHMNLRVGLLLRRLLVDAGANVIMTREGDDTIGLRERAAVANRAVRPDGGVGADLFVSIHHNAAGSGANYTSVWYHGTVDHNEVELDVAEPIAHALGREMRTDVAKTSPVLSSHLMYPTGFGVLRACEVPAILIECSFYTNPDEERRLLDAGYNLREAYGIYVGLCEWAYGGRPTQAITATRADDEHALVTAKLDEGLPGWWGSDRPRIVSSTIAVLADGVRVPFEYDERTQELRATVPLDHFRAGTNDLLRSDESATQAAEASDLRTCVLEVHHANMFKHHNWPQRYQLTLSPDSTDLVVQPLGAIRDAYRTPATAPAPPTTRPAD
jgi:N-acetylmuramoyl-L-alanine amidase